MGLSIWNTYIDKLNSRERITEDMADMLKHMVVESDPEYLNMAKEILKDKIGEILRNGLNEGQTEIFNNAVEYIEDNSNNYGAFMINGYAGTGKTFLVKRIIEYICATQEGGVCVTAPTNKAVKVLAEGTQRMFIEEGQKLNSNISYCTTHKYLTLKEYVDDEGNVSFRPNGQGMEKYSYLIIDEASMVNKEIANYIFTVRAKHFPEQKIILIGDEAQIPPVNEDYSVLFTDFNNIHKETLNEIVRQKGKNPIIEYSIKVRDNMKSFNPLQKEKGKKNKDGEVKIFNEKKDAAKIIEKYLAKDEYKNDSSFFKIVAWRNKTLDYLNQFCRRKLFGDNAPKYVVGEKLIANSTIYEEKKEMNLEFLVAINTSQEMTIDHIDHVVIDRNPFILAFQKKVELKLNALRLSVTLENGKKKLIFVLEDSSKYVWLNFMSKLKQECIKKKQSIFWVQYYEIGKLIANVGYAYAISVHKSQGSTFENVLMMDSDIEENWKTMEKNKIRYTAITRASKNLYIY